VQRTITNHKETQVKNILVTLLATIGIVVSAQAQNTVNGAGATFPAPLYAKWAEAYHKATGVRINYQSVGSGAGIRQIEGKTVTFGASDMPLTDDRLASFGAVQWPMVIGGVVPVINLKDVKPGELRLTGTVMADIFLGKIKKWNDSAITKLNPNLKLPDQDIMVVRRADGSGTTFIWTNYLSKVNPEFKSTIGEGTAVNWKVGAGGKGNEGVAAMVRQLPGALGYVEYAYVKQTKMNWVQVQNRDGAWVAPDDETFKAAAAGADWNSTFYQILTEQPGKNTWPISGATFIIMHVNPTKADESREAIKFFNWSLDNGDKMALDLDYVPMPDAVVPKIKAEMQKVKSL
jgi:phosphate transport system substrate-binding protein